jgi:hypothetical protein
MARAAQIGNDARGDETRYASDKSAHGTCSVFESIKVELDEACATCLG